ncbi:unnamed protein product [Adineta steineri]|uniref:Uncharacterized protein n=1 Tax=Adineta steineri TaxID=433720 RepID=A0A814N0S7_9BILA|nr:unnamed protein product [Adineta steineri]CAF4204023.1 unnamed protein product [Adineta steineri]
MFFTTFFTWVYIHTGDVYNTITIFATALLYYEKALKIFLNHNADNRNIARLYRKMSDIYLKQNNNEIAIICQELITSAAHLEFQRANTLCSIGVCFCEE